jgi:hypothetical protein
MGTAIRFHCHVHGPVKIKITEGQTLRHVDVFDNGEGWSRVYREWRFDGEKLTLELVRDATDCDGRHTTYHTLECPIQDVRAGPLHEGIEWPAWRDVRSSQRDHSAEAMGY